MKWEQLWSSWERSVSQWFQNLKLRFFFSKEDGFGPKGRSLDGNNWLFAISRRRKVSKGLTMYRRIRSSVHSLRDDNKSSVGLQRELPLALVQITIGRPHNKYRKREKNGWNCAKWRHASAGIRPRENWQHNSAVSAQKSSSGNDVSFSSCLRHPSCRNNSIF